MTGWCMTCHTVYYDVESFDVHQRSCPPEVRLSDAHAKVVAGYGRCNLRPTTRESA